ncbi:MAG: biopolymer transporter ExbD [Verrucomicrobiales bacterium]|nr:biopolymer transporter ExbD [Verrucomicrobiales bacterium]
MKRGKRRIAKVVEMQMTPMIDMVFLLLVFFMVTSKPIKPEADISIALPGQVSQEEALDIPDEQRIVILRSGQVVLNEQVLGEAGDRALGELVVVLKRFKLAAQRSRSEALITLAPEDEVKHQRLVDVLNACALAEIKGVTFAAGDSGGDEGGGL